MKKTLKKKTKYMRNNTDKYNAKNRHKKTKGWCMVLISDGDSKNVAQGKYTCAPISELPSNIQRYFITTDKKYYFWWYTVCPRSLVHFNIANITKGQYFWDNQYRPTIYLFTSMFTVSKSQLFV